MKKTLLAILFTLVVSGGAYSEEMYLECLLIKESKPTSYTKEPNPEKYYEYFTLDTSSNSAERTAMGVYNAVKKDGYIFPKAYMQDEYYLFGKQWKSQGVDFYIYYQLEINEIMKNGKGNMVYLYNNVAGLDGLVTDQYDAFNCLKKITPAKFIK